MSGRIIVSLEQDPYRNIAIEDGLFQDAQADVLLLLWQNKPSVIMGRNQNIYAECNLEHIRQHNILPVRRYSGGGAVYHDLGNVNYTFITLEQEIKEEVLLRVVKSAIENLGLKCEFSGRNDLLCDGRKFSGQAYRTEDGRYMLHGTVMVHVDLAAMEKAITPDRIKLESKGILSVRSRVMNLREKLPQLTTEEVILSFIISFSQEFQNASILKDQRANQKDLERAELLSSERWIYGECPQYSIQLTKIVKEQRINIRLLIENGVVQQAKLYTDSLHLTNMDAMETLLIGIHYEEEKIVSILEKCI